jgi:hypothetical protein
MKVVILVVPVSNLDTKFSKNSPLLEEKIYDDTKKFCKGTPSEESADKLVNFLRESKSKQCEYAWVDAICINKESSAELDESIRSMYAWYRDSYICIVYLNQTIHRHYMVVDPWFTRGWTLQELLAPKRIAFYSMDWMKITTEDRDKLHDKQQMQMAEDGNIEGSLWPTISSITGIPIDDLLDFKPGLYEVGKRMNWVSKRSTTRIEDMAYCLIGIFRVNLSISYGEKEGAFYRLQAEIQQTGNDKSLFCWKGIASPYNSMFAASPECFSGVDMEDMQLSDYDPASVPVNLTLRMSLVLYQKSEFPLKQAKRLPEATAFAILGRSPRPGEYLILILEQVEEDHEYKRLGIISVPIKQALLTKKPDEIIIR